jgi:hypothetical protein
VNRSIARKRKTIASNRNTWPNYGNTIRNTPVLRRRFRFDRQGCDELTDGKTEPRCSIGGPDATVQTANLGDTNMMTKACARGDLLCFRQ